jgi:hypothetical protein
MNAWAAQYKDSRWQKKRLEVMERDKWKCRSCGASGDGVTLNVHHAYYDHGRAPWEYQNRILVTWCEDCHKARHAMMQHMQEELAMLPMIAMNGALHLAVNYRGVLECFGHECNANNMPSDDIMCSAIGALSAAHEEAVSDHTEAVPQVCKDGAA